MDQVKAPERHEVMVDTNIDSFDMSYEESVSSTLLSVKVRSTF
jgi:hypothetical protein